MLETLEIIKELSALFSGADVYWMPKSEPELRAYLQGAPSQKLGASLGTHAAVSQICALDSEHIYEFTPFPGVSALVYADRIQEKVLFVGPVTTEAYTQQSFTAYLQQQSIPAKTARQLITSVNKLPNMPSYQLYRFMDILLRQVCQLSIPIPIKRIEPTYNASPLSLLPDMAHQKDIAYIRQVENRYEISTMLTEAVKLGNLPLALQAMQNSEMPEGIINRNANPLRNAQNYCIVLNTQLRHTLESSSIHPVSLDQLSNEIGMQIERLNSVKTLVPFCLYIIEQYCRLVQEQSYQNLSSIVHQAVIYIKNNLSANLSVMNTAKELSVHPDYLSHQFSTEMGMSFITFLNRERCTQAASFLKHTSLQIKQISAIVGFNTISYFTKQFRNQYGKTPRDYRNERIYRKQAE